MEATHLTKEELESLRSMHSQINNLQRSIGALEFEKAGMIGELAMTRESFKTLEGKISEKYGSDSIINLQTGEISKKEERIPGMTVSKK